MTLRQYLILMSIGTAICWFIWFLIIGNIDPTEAGWLGLLFFYSSLFLSLSGSFSVCGFLIRKAISKSDTVVFHHVRHTFRQGILITSLIIAALFLAQFKLLTWLTGCLVVILFLLLESIILANRKYKNRDFV